MKHKKSVRKLLIDSIGSAQIVGLDEPGSMDQALTVMADDDNIEDV